ncbi:hypothetical protein HELRODRAFT_167329 [Helobdella robusta]|uniref:Uncharacterized protein n=1 Tax=Helobdella robusta TaxID=6412 RepID=T1EZ96_HELRO|nr:hypothetical protein HELRODRAFT_167329 [Helobdella robusta]ESO10828.1 hypothetical protein HELRODRAFT_167329 [Helobdella robusta]
MTDIKSNQQQQQNEHISHQKPQQKEWPTNSRLYQLRNERVRSISTSYDEPDVVVDMDVNNYSNNCNNTDHKRPSPNIHLRFQKGCTPMSQMLASRIPNSLSLHEDEIKSTTSNKIGPEEFVEMMRRRKTPLYLNHLFYQQQQLQQLMKGRRRTVSENQASLMLKFPQTLRQKYADQSQIPNVVVLDRQPVVRQKSAASDHASPPSDGLLVGLAAAGALVGPAGEMTGAVGSGGGGILTADGSGGGISGSGGGISGVASGVNNRKLLHQNVSGGRLLAAKHSSIGHDPMNASWLSYFAIK